MDQAWRVSRDLSRSGGGARGPIRVLAAGRRPRRCGRADLWLGRRGGNAVGPSELSGEAGVYSHLPVHRFAGSGVYHRPCGACYGSYSAFSPLNSFRARLRSLS